MKLETMEAKVDDEGIDGSNLQYQLGNKIYMGEELACLFK